MNEIECLEERKRELLDGKRIWNYQENAGGDFDVFFSEFVVPLRELQYAGFFDKSRERELNRRGGTRIASFHVLGAINYNAKSGNEE